MQQDKISDLPEKTTPVSGDLIEIESPSDSSSKHVTLTNLPKAFVAQSMDGEVVEDGTLSLDALSGEAWQSWSPTFTALSGGTLNEAVYTRIGKTVHFRLKYTMSGANISGSPSFTLPVTPVQQDGGISPFNAICVFYDQSAGANGRYYGFGVADGSGGLVPSLIVASETYARRDTVGNTKPFTWGSGDVMYVAGSYEGV